jgi:hypothetical protein
MDTKMSNSFVKKIIFFFWAMTVLLATSGCAINTFVVDQVAKNLVSEDDHEQDLFLARDASPFYLKLTENLLIRSPANLKLAQAVCSGFTQYAYTFIAFEAEKLEGSDYKRAELLRERASKMYARAFNHGMKALDLTLSGFGAKLKASGNMDPKAIPSTNVGLLYWTAASLGGWISTAKDMPDLVADFPIALRLAHLAWQIDPSYSQGSLASLMGNFEWANPNGSKPLATQYFDWAIQYSKDQNAGPFVSKAEKVAVAMKDRRMFEKLLNQAKEIAQKYPNLQNEAMRLRAQWLLENADELFES